MDTRQAEINKEIENLKFKIEDIKKVQEKITKLEEEKKLELEKIAKLTEEEAKENLLQDIEKNTKKIF